jgi:exosortase
MSAPASSAPPAAGSPVAVALRWLPLALILGWWVQDLWFQWEAQAEYRFGKIVVLLAAYLVWERWDTRPREDAPPPAWKSFALALPGFLLVTYSELFRIGIARLPNTSFLLSVGCTLFAAAYIQQAAGACTLRHFLFPLLFFFVAVPLPGLIWQPIVGGLQSLVTFLNVETLGLLGIPAERQGNIIHLPNATVGVDEACSGVRRLQSSIMAGLFVGDLVLRRFGWKVFFVAAGIALAIVGNFGRSLFLSLTAHARGTAALNAVHDSAGWSVLVFTFVGVALLAWWVTKLEKRAQAMTPAAEPAPESAA